MAKPHPKVDAVIIGVGWVGGIIASELTKAGLKVSGSNEAPSAASRTSRRTTTSSPMRSGTSCSRTPRRRKHGRCATTSREPALPIRQLGSFLPGTGLGGAGVHWNGQTWRFHPRDFTIRTSMNMQKPTSALDHGQGVAVRLTAAGRLETDMAQRWPA